MLLSGPTRSLLLVTALVSCAPLIGCDGPGAATPAPVSAVVATQQPPPSRSAAPRPSEPSAARSSPSGECFVDLASEPPSEVTLDDRNLGFTPQPRVAIASGSHRARFVTGAERKEVSFSCAPGELKVVRVRLPGAPRVRPTSSDAGYGFYE